MREWADRRRPALEREPWCSAPPFAILCLQHRLALHSNAEIAAHYGISDGAVRSHLDRLRRHLASKAPLPVGGQAELLVIAERDGVPQSRLTHSPVNQGRHLSEGEAHS